MPIVPLPQFEQDLAEYTDEQDRIAREKLTAPKTVVCRFGAMKFIGEFRYSLDVTPGCGSKLIARTFRGTEMGEMLTSTCPNSGCGKSISRKEMLEYIDHSGGRDYPFYEKGRILRVATPEDMDAQAKLEQSAHELKLRARTVADEIGVSIRIVQAEGILGGETLTYYYLAEANEGLPPGQQPKGNQPRRGPDPRLQAGQLRDALQKEAPEATRVEVRPVGARDEARLTADYERCGQHCCCTNFLKVLKPVPMRAAKQQKATLDPLKISGRCGRLMCCLRYEDESYRELAARLPHRKTPVGTTEGAGIVLDTQILTQLVLVKLDFDGREVAIPLEELIDPADAPDPAAKVVAPPPPPRTRPRPSKPKSGPKRDGERAKEGDTADAPVRKKKRRRKKKRSADGSAPAKGPDTDQPRPLDGEAGPRKKKRRKRRRKKPGGEDGQGGGPQDRSPPSEPRA